MKNRLLIIILLTGMLWPLGAMAFFVNEFSSNRTFNQQRLEEFRNDSDFIYKDVKIEDPSWLEAFSRWLSQGLFTLDRSFDGNIWTTIFFIIVAIILVYAITRMAGIDLFTYRAGQKASTLEYTIEEENIHEIDFDKEIEESLNNGHFRRVVRLIYLHMLKELADRDRISWKPNKTNTDYLAEMRNDPLASDFQTLNYYFTYSWYGDFNINLAQVEKVRSVFNHMRTDMNRS